MAASWSRPPIAARLSRADPARPVPVQRRAVRTAARTQPRARNCMHVTSRARDCCEMHSSSRTHDCSGTCSCRHTRNCNRMLRRPSPFTPLLTAAGASKGGKGGREGKIFRGDNARGGRRGPFPPPGPVFFPPVTFPARAYFCSAGRWQVSGARALPVPLPAPAPVGGRVMGVADSGGGVAAVKSTALVARELVAPVARESVAPAARLAAEPVTPVARVPVALVPRVPVAPVARVPAASAVAHNLLSAHGPSSSSLALSFRCTWCTPSGGVLHMVLHHRQ
ncbi:unnamed protein product [Closterium sp. NIES-53]